MVFSRQRLWYHSGMHNFWHNARKSMSAVRAARHDSRTRDDSAFYLFTKIIAQSKKEAFDARVALGWPEKIATSPPEPTQTWNMRIATNPAEKKCNPLSKTLTGSLVWNDWLELLLVDLVTTSFAKERVKCCSVAAAHKVDSCRC